MNIVSPTGSIMSTTKESLERILRGNIGMRTLQKPVEIVLRRGEVGRRENGGGGKSNSDIM
jgi:hypothetical protein